VVLRQFCGVAAATANEPPDLRTSNCGLGSADSADCAAEPRHVVRCTGPLARRGRVSNKQW
jgi:hypothetical protein